MGYRHSYSNITDLAHSFYYQGNDFDDETCYTRSASYRGRVFNSYGTTIGAIVRGKNGNVLLYSDAYMSSTTSKHLSALKNASPFHKLACPFDYGHSLFRCTEKEIVRFIKEQFERELANDKKQKHSYTRKEHREFSTGLLERAKEFAETFGVKIKGLAVYEKYLEKCLNSDNIKAHLAKIRQASIKKAENQRKKIEKFKSDLGKTDYCELVKRYIANYNWNDKADKEIRDLLVASTGIDYPSFVWVDKDNEVVRTSQHITMPISKVVPLLKLWNSKHNIIGKSIGEYTILANNDTMVKIGCHEIPLDNIKSLYKHLVG